MAKVYSIKELAAMLKPGQLGMQYRQAMLIFRPYQNGDPRVKALVEMSAWQKVRGSDGALQAIPTLEAYNSLVEFGLEFEPTQKVVRWIYSVSDASTSFKSSVQMDYRSETLYDYQREAAEFLACRDRALLALSPGLGKTLTSAFAAGVRGFDNVLVVCPASLLFYWKGELEKWADKLPRKPYPQVWHREIVPMDDELMYPDQFWAITNPETVTKHLDSFLAGDFDCLIVDESIMYKHRDSGRSKALKELAQSIDVCWLLSGAPATRYLDDMWHQFHILKPKGYSSYWRFARKYCYVDDTDWGSKVVANKPNAEAEIKKNFADVYFSRTQDDVADIPDWIFEDVDIPMLPAQDRAYEKLRKELLIELDTLDPGEVIHVNNHLSLMIRSIQVASNPLLVGGVDSAGKWDALPELMEVYPGPYIVWCNFVETGQILRDRFSKASKRVALANGSTKMDDRNSMVNAIQNGELDILILNNDVGKFGWTLTKARTAFFVERTYSDAYFQCLHRNRRIGTTQSPIVVNMLSVTQKGNKTIDHTIGSVLDYRTGMIQKITAGDLKKVFSNE